MEKKERGYDKIEKPLVSVLIPVYNAEKFIYGAIRSAVVQEYDNIEVIVLDDASTDETANICKSFGDRIRYIKNEKNMGIGYGRKRLVDESKGEYIVFCSADDILSTQFVDNMMAESKKNPEKILYCNFFIIDNLGKVVNEYSTTGFKESDDFCVASYESALRHSMFVNFSCVLIPKPVFSKVQFDPNIRYGEDLDFLLKSMKYFGYVHIPITLVKYRVHMEMITKKKWYDIERNNKKIIAAWEKWWGENDG